MEYRDKEEDLLFDKPSDWGEGPWLNEPGNQATEIFEHNGYKCALARNHGGAWCGYVSVPKDSKWAKDSKYEELDVHGGVTWSDDRLPWLEADESLFWIGFDCNHFNDYAPRMQALMKKSADIFPGIKELDEKYKAILTDSPMRNTKNYRTMKYARQQIIGMIEQIEKDK